MMRPHMRTHKHNVSTTDQLGNTHKTTYTQNKHNINKQNKQHQIKTHNYTETQHARPLIQYQ